MINNNIQEAYCSFEVSKLLKEKGLDCGTHTIAYNEDGTKKISPYSSFYDPYKYPILNCTHLLAIEWIRVNFGIWIQPCQHYTKYTWDALRYEYKGHYNIHIANGRTFYPECYNSPQEAIEAAIEYTLKNLIP